MAKQFAATLLLLGLLSLGGCSTAEKPPQTDQSSTAGPNELAAQPQEPVQRKGTASAPPEATLQPIPTAEDEIATPAAVETAEIDAGFETPAEKPDPDEAAVAAQPSQVDVNEPVAAEPSEPNDVQAIEPKDVRSVEPNDVTAVEPDGAVAIPGEPDDTTTEPREADEETFTAPFYREYAKILKTYVLENGLVDYSTLDRRRLDLKAILMDLDELDPNVYQGWSNDEKLAFWINAYNLKMLDIITRNYPIRSSWWLRLTWPPSDIRHIKDIWTGYKFIVMDEEFTLDAVERRFFREMFDDPRAYLAITYASRSSPSLRRTPYRGEGIDRQLDQHVKGFLDGPQGIEIDRRDRVVRLPALFKPSWRGKEFVSRYGTDKKFKNRDSETRAVLSFLARYLPAEEVYFLEVENYRIEYRNFDWRLNDTSRSY